MDPLEVKELEIFSFGIMYLELFVSKLLPISMKNLASSI